MDQIELLTRACALTQRQVDAAVACPDGQTGCADWNATQLVNHMVVTLGMWADIMAGEQPKHDPFDAPNILGDDMAADFRAAADRAIAAFSGEGVLERNYPSPAGEMPGAALITFPTYDVFIHGWDLEQATGLAGEYPDDLTAVAMGFSQQSFSDQRPPQIVGPAVEVGTDASAFDRLIAFNGRRP